MTVIFRARSREGHVIKMLAEVLARNIKTGCFQIDASGISLCTSDHHKLVLVNMTLKAECLQPYKFAPTPGLRYYDAPSGKMYLGLTMSHFQRMLSSIKKKDKVELYIDDDDPMLLRIAIIPDDASRDAGEHSSTTTVTIQAIRELQPELPTGYEGPGILARSGEYQKMIKSMIKIGNTVSLIATQYKATFSCAQPGVGMRTDSYGTEDTDDERAPTLLEKEYHTELLCRLSKLSGLNANITVHIGSPIMFKTNIGFGTIPLGFIEIYIKSKQEIEEDKKALEEAEFEDDWGDR